MNVHIQTNYLVDSAAVWLLAEQVCSVAGNLEGDFCIVTISDAGQMRHYPVPNGCDAVKRIFLLVEQIGAEPHQNVYFAGALFRPGSVDPYTGKGRTEANVVGVLCAVLDFDADNDPATRRERLPLPPCSELESSPGNFQCHFWFDRLYAGVEIKPVLAALAAVSGADVCKSTEHLWRVPGTWNWPHQKKVAKGRSPEPFQTFWSIVP